MYSAIARLHTSESYRVAARLRLADVQGNRQAPQELIVSCSGAFFEEASIASGGAASDIQEYAHMSGSAARRQLLMRFFCGGSTRVRRSSSAVGLASRGKIDQTSFIFLSRPNAILSCEGRMSCWRGG